MIQIRGNVGRKLKEGDKAVFTRTFTESDTLSFVGLSGDYNPHHVDAEFCKRTRFEAPIVPGFLVASMATHIGGQWAVLAARFHMDFLAPVYIGDTVTCTAEVVSVKENYKIRVDFTCTNTEGIDVVRGYFTGYPPKGKALHHLRGKDR